MFRYESIPNPNETVSKKDNNKVNKLGYILLGIFLTIISYYSYNYFFTSSDSLASLHNINAIESHQINANDIIVPNHQYTIVANGQYLTATGIGENVEMSDDELTDGSQYWTFTSSGSFNSGNAVSGYFSNVLYGGYLYGENEEMISLVSGTGTIWWTKLYYNSGDMYCIIRDYYGWTQYKEYCCLGIEDNGDVEDSNDCCDTQWTFNTVSS